jgi:hypothetical protein
MENQKKYKYKHNVYKAVINISYTVGNNTFHYKHDVLGKLNFGAYMDRPDYIVIVKASKLVYEYIKNIYEFGFVDIEKEYSEKSNFIPIYKINNISVRYYDNIIESDLTE